MSRPETGALVRAPSLSRVVDLGTAMVLLATFWARSILGADDARSEVAVHVEPIGAALGLVTATSVVVSAVAVLPAARGQGLGTALTQHAMRLAPDLPATLSSSQLGYEVYRRLGFVEVGRPVHWNVA